MPYKNALDAKSGNDEMLTALVRNVRSWYILMEFDKAKSRLCLTAQYSSCLNAVHDS